MKQQHKIDVTDKNGWLRTYTLAKNIIHIGSQEYNDIALDGWDGGAATRLQLIAVNQRFRLVNLSDRDLPIEHPTQPSLPPRSTIDIEGGKPITVNGFKFVFYYGEKIPQGQKIISEEQEAGIIHGVSGEDEDSENIGLVLSLPNIQLNPYYPLEGTITVHNKGDKNGVQFMLDIEGIDAELFEVGPGPILFPNAKRDVSLQIHHPCQISPTAGNYRIRIRASAPDDYPGEVTSVTQIIQIMPFYKHQIELIPIK